MVIRSNFSLHSLNTFRINVKAKYLVEVFDEVDVLKVLDNPKLKLLPKFVLGQGSNVLFRRDFDGLVILVKIKGRKILEKTEEEVLVELGAGEDWHKFVTWAVDKGWGGVENLVYIPGTVGAAPVQNIAAYGQNLEDIFSSLEAVNLKTGEVERFNKKACEFGYRESIFKKRLEVQYVIVRVRLKLRRKFSLETSYFSIGGHFASINNELKRLSIEPYTIKDVYRAVLALRQRKLPDVKNVPNAGSFFLNPIVNKEKLKKLQDKIPNLQYYPVERLLYRKLDGPDLKEDLYVKVAAGRLLDELGWRGKWIGNCGIYKKHALIVVHNGRANGQEILDFANMVKKDFFNHYGIELKAEVNIV